jgi:hypothetical protein
MRLCDSLSFIGPVGRCQGNGTDCLHSNFHRGRLNVRGRILKGGFRAHETSPWPVAVGGSLSEQRVAAVSVTVGCLFLIQRITSLALEIECVAASENNNIQGWTSVRISASSLAHVVPSARAFVRRGSVDRDSLCWVHTWVLRGDVRSVH